MGSFGYEPHKNDAALDIFDEGVSAMSNFLEGHVKKTLEYSDDMHSRAGAIYLFNKTFRELNVSYVPSLLLTVAIEDLEACLQDSDFISGWKDPKEFVKVTKQVIEEMKENLAELQEPSGPELFLIAEPGSFPEEGELGPEMEEPELPEDYEEEPPDDDDEDWGLDLPTKF